MSFPKKVRTILCLLFAMALTSTNLLAADCSQSSITLRSQLDVDTFQATFGNGGICDTVTSRLEVNSVGIINLDALSDLIDVGNLIIFDNGALISLGGLSSLTTVRGELLISFNDVLTTASLPALASVGFRLLVESNPKLTDFTVSSGLTTIGDELSIGFNDSLVNIDMAGLVNVTSNLHLTYNDSLTSLDGLSSLTGVGGFVYIANNPGLFGCAGLVALLDDVDDPPNGPGPGVAGIPDVAESVYIAQNALGCNSLPAVLGYAGLRLTKTFSDGALSGSTFALECDSPGVAVTALEDQASQNQPALFQIEGLEDLAETTCSAIETESPPGYTPDLTACTNIVVSNRTTAECHVVNNQDPVVVTIKKAYSSTPPDMEREVAVTLSCTSGNISPDTTLTTVDGVAMFEVSDFHPDGQTCQATEVIPYGYLQIDANGCDSLRVEPGVDPAPACTFTNALDPTMIFYDGFEIQ